MSVVFVIVFVVVVVVMYVIVDSIHSYPLFHPAHPAHQQYTVHTLPRPLSRSKSPQAKWTIPPQNETAPETAEIRAVEASLLY